MKETTNTIIMLYIEAHANKDIKAIKVYGKYLSLKGFTRQDIEKIKESVSI